MKKMRFVVLAFMLIMLMCVSSAFAAEPGETVTVNMNLSNSDAIIFTLGSPSYDASALEVVGQNPAAGHTFVDINSDGYTPYPSGKIGTVTVKIRDNAKPGTYTISFSTSGAVSVDLGSARLSVSATVTVVCPHTNTETIPGKAATCTETGLTDGTKCSVCDVVIKAQEEIPANGHIEVTVPGKDSTCAEAGLTEGSECAVCGVVIKAQEEIPTKEHNFNKHVVDPTTTSRGYTIYTCKVCEYTYTANYTNKLDSDEDGMCAYGDIVTSAEGEYKEYTADAIEDEIKILVITAEPEEDGTYATRNLHLSSDLLAVFKAEGIIEIYFVVGNAAVNIPVAIFENEAMKAAADAENCNNFVITLSIADAEIENAISPKYSVVVALDKDEDIDVTENAIGVKLLLPWEGAQSCVNDENVAYTVSQNEEAWVIDVTKVDFYTLIAE